MKQTLKMPPYSAPSMQRRYKTFNPFKGNLLSSGKFTAGLTTMILFLFGLGFSTNAATYTVNSLADDNTGSGTSGTLRYCITQANSIAGPHTINFSVAGTITLGTTLLPDITQRMTINGYSAPGATAGTFASRVITMQIIAPVGATSTLNIRASGTTISGINFISFCDAFSNPTASIYHANSNTATVNNVWVWGCSFNTNMAGTAVYSNAGGCGLAIYGNTSGTPAVSNLSGWIVGVNGDGVNDANEGNQFTSPDPALGSIAINEAIRLQHADSFVVAGNYFGLQKDGTTPIMAFNTTVGQNYHISLTNVTGTRIGTDRNGTSDAFERNVIVGARGNAIAIFANNNGGSFGGSGTVLRTPSNNVIYGNYIGTDVTGQATGTNLANRTGVRIDGSSGNTIGSVLAAGRNVIVNSLSTGVSIIGSRFGSPFFTVTSQNNTITGNYIGMLADGTSPSGNGTGIQINSNNLMQANNVSAINNTINQNIIANNSGIGVNILASSSQPVLVYSNRITQNSIYNNGSLGINISSATFDQQVSPNDGVLSAFASTTAVNQMVDYGVITNMSISGNNLTINGYIGNDAAGNASFANSVVEFFIADNNPANQNGERIQGDGLSVPHGEGRTYLGSLTANANGLFSGTLNVTGLGVTTGSEITNTVTTASNSTSEFGVNVSVGLIQGNVFNDVNGNIDGIVNGAGTNGGTTLYAVLYNVSTGQVEAFTTVAASGAYSLSGIVGVDYSIYLSTTLPTIGQAALPALTLPNGWAYTGEMNCVNTSNCAGDDGNANGVLALGVVASPITQANLGIQRLPETDPKSYLLVTNPVSGSSIALNGGLGNPPLMSGTDPEDGTYSGNSGTVRNPHGVKITSLPSNGELWYNGVQVTLADLNNTIFADPALFSIVFTGSGYNTTSFQYAYVDAAGTTDPTPATFTINWSQPLPVMITSFEAMKSGNNVVLQWTTVHEHNNQGFQMQRSRDGSNWERIGWVNSQGERGNSNHRLDYAFVAAAPLRAKSFYRLLQVDFDGKQSRSEVRIIDMDATGQIRIYPNPVADKLTIEGLNGEEMLRLYDVTGRQVLKIHTDQPITTIDLSNVINGVYYLDISSKNRKAIEKVVKFNK